MMSTRPERILLLEQLCNAVAVSGDEREVRQIVLAALDGHVDDLSVDPLGSVIAVKRGTARRRTRVMLSAHMDEVGLMIVGTDQPGSLRFEIVGGLDTRYLQGKRVLVGKHRLPGVIGAIPPHLLPEGESGKVDHASLRIELGPGASAEIGDRAAYEPRTRVVGGLVFAKSIDDRIGVATLIELLQHTYRAIDLYAVFSVQEEVGARGAWAAAQRIDPGLAIVIDATAAHDQPTDDDSENTWYNSRLGFGPAVYAADSRTIYDARLVELVRSAAVRRRIPIQTRQPTRGGTDAGGIQRALSGIPCVAVSVPHRYPHSPISIARIDDWENTIALLEASLRILSRTPAASTRARRGV